MPYDLHIVKTSDFVRLDAHGKPDLEQSRNVLASIAKTCMERGVLCALLDVRDLYSSFTTNDLYRLVQAFREVGFQEKHRLAILHRFRSERAEIFTTFAADEGLNVRGFEDYGEAIEWFAEQESLKNQKQERH